MKLTNFKRKRNDLYAKIIDSIGFPFGNEGYFVANYANDGAINYIAYERIVEWRIGLMGFVKTEKVIMIPDMCGYKEIDNEIMVYSLIDWLTL